MRPQRGDTDIEPIQQAGDYYSIGENAQVDAGVVLGYRYSGDREPTRIGDNAVIRSGSTIYADTVIGNRFSCGHNVLIRANIKIGDRVVVHHGSTLEGSLEIGSGVKIMAHVYVPSQAKIGNMVFIGPGVTILNDKMPMRRKVAQLSGVTIQDHVMIGGHVTICPGVTVGARSFIAAGALLTKDVPPDTLAFGTPAQFTELPEQLAGGNLPEHLLPQTDLFGAQQDPSWQNEDPRLWSGSR